MSESIKEAIILGRTALGIELGSTRIKAVLVGADNTPIASGSYDWENRLEDGIWTYHLDEVWQGLQGCYSALKQDVQAKFATPLKAVGAIGISAMMHGYLPFDKAGGQLAPFRTWRNTMTGAESEELTKLFNFNIPQRWSIAHLYQCVRANEQHVEQIDYLTTLAGYVHWMLTGCKVMGVGEASGMFPIDSCTCDFDQGMVDTFDALIAPKGYPWKLRNILPKVLPAGADAGRLTQAGAALLDPSGDLPAGIPLCPPEGDAGTGMVATNSVAQRTGNVSAGTSVFAMVVLEKALSTVYPEIDMVTTPSGSPVAMVHCNNCTSDLNAWVGLFGEFAREMGLDVDQNTLFTTLYRKAMQADRDGGDLLAYNFYSGEHIVGLTEGRPLFVRKPDSHFTLANFMRTHLYASLGVLATGMKILLDKEQVHIDNIYGHGGMFKTKGVGQSILAAAIKSPVCVMETAGEGGAWGVALLAAYLLNKQCGQTLEDYLADKVFGGNQGERLAPTQEDMAGFDAFMAKYTPGLDIERQAVKVFP